MHRPNLWLKTRIKIMSTTAVSLLSNIRSCLPEICEKFAMSVRRLQLSVSYFLNHESTTTRGRIRFTHKLRTLGEKFLSPANATTLIELQYSLNFHLTTHQHLQKIF